MVARRGYSGWYWLSRDRKELQWRELAEREFRNERPYDLTLLRDCHWLRSWRRGDVSQHNRLRRWWDGLLRRPRGVYWVQLSFADLDGLMLVLVNLMDRSMAC